ncbi:MAG: hypothetical protein IPF97_08130 [Sphingomonadales bacterium]|nr:hypothetical protein [Sphingomonadales bacterium]
MQVNRIGLTGFASTAVRPAEGRWSVSEIVSWKLRLFVPDDAVPGVGGDRRALFDRHPLARILARKAA